jgi:CBS domain-containing protein
MELSNQARMVSIFLTEKERYQGRPLYTAICEYLRANGATGMTMFRGVEGFGVHQQVHTTRIEMLMYDLPILIEWIDSVEQVDRLLPDISDMVTEGLVTLQPVTVVKHAIRDLRPISGIQTVADMMTREPKFVQEATPLAEVVELLVWRLYRALPVVDADKRVVGIVTNGDLVQRGGLNLRTELLHTLQPEDLEHQLARLAEHGRTAADVMSSDVVTVKGYSPLSDAAHIMASRKLKRLPVVDQDDRLIGIISRVDVLRTLTLHPVLESGNQVMESNVSFDSPVAEIMNPAAPVVDVNAGLPEVLDTIISTRLNRAVVVDDQLRPLGVITDAELMRRLDPQHHSGLINALMRHMPFVGNSPEAREDDHFFSGKRAGDLMISPALTITESTTIVEATRLMLERQYKILPVVDAAGRLVGIIDRADLLRAAAGH